MPVFAKSANHRLFLVFSLTFRPKRRKPKRHRNRAHLHAMRKNLPTSCRKIIVGRGMAVWRNQFHLYHAFSSPGGDERKGHSKPSAPLR